MTGDTTIFNEGGRRVLGTGNSAVDILLIGQAESLNRADRIGEEMKRVRAQLSSMESDQAFCIERASSCREAATKLGFPAEL